MYGILAKYTKFDGWTQSRVRPVPRSVVQPHEVWIDPTRDTACSAVPTGEAIHRDGGGTKDMRLYKWEECGQSVWSNA